MITPDQANCGKKQINQAAAEGKKDITRECTMNGCSAIVWSIDAKGKIVAVSGRRCLAAWIRTEKRKSGTPRNK